MKMITTTIIYLLFGYSNANGCEDFCIEDCSVLNGNYTNECQNCTIDYLCNPLSEAYIEPWLNNNITVLNNTIKITMMLGQIIKQIETVKICGKVPTGSDKKAIVIQVGNIILKEINQPEIIMIYDIIADQTLETIIDVSKVVNVYAQEIATSCCPNFFKRK